MLGNPSIQRISTLHPDLARVVEHAAFAVRAHLQKEYEAKVSEIEQSDEPDWESLKPIPDVFEILHADDGGRHEQIKFGDDAFSLAVDIAPRVGFGPGVDDWEAEGYSDDDEQHMRRIVKAMFDASKALDIPISYGGDFRPDGKKQRPRNWRSPHFQLTTKE